MPYSLGSLTIYHYGEEGSGFEDHAGGAQEFEAIRETCLSDGTLFEDPEFPAEYSSVYHDHIEKEIEWVRPSKIVENPQFFLDGACRFDVNQGELGNCWFIASVASLTMDEKVFHQVVPEDNSFAEENYCGAFHFRFWQFGHWVDVVIDDRLPTCNGRLVFMHSAEKNEFWSALLEKAYAKLYGCYETLTSGMNIEALEDFTGGLAEKYKIHDETAVPSNLLRIMLKGHERGSLMGCSLQGTGSGESEGPYGLICGHAYTITSVKQLEINGNTVSLVRIRNPWGNQAEWTGRWSDHSEEWNEADDNTKEILELTNKEDGEFWMCYEDFIHYFSLLEICHLGPQGMLIGDDVPKKKWEMKVFEDSWVKGATAGGCTNFMQSFPYNPQFNIEITDPDPDDDEDQCTVIVALMQKFRRANRAKNSSIGFYLYRIDGDNAINVSKPLRGDFFRYNRSAGRVNAFENSRELCCRFRLNPGTYCIIPSCFEPNVEGNFLLRVFSETETVMEINDIEEPIDISEEVKDWGDTELPEKVIQAFNDKSDSDVVQLPDFQEILSRNIQVDFEFEGFDEPLCRLLVEDTAGENGITLDVLARSWSLVQNYLKVFLHLDEDGSGHLDPFELWPGLMEAGFKINTSSFKYLLLKFGDEDKNVHFGKFIACLLVMFKLQNFLKNEDNTQSFSFQRWIDAECEALQV